MSSCQSPAGRTLGIRALGLAWTRTTVDGRPLGRTARFGLAMPGSPPLGSRYYQEQAPEIDEAVAKSGLADGVAQANTSLSL
jgi:hypothetical protein